MSSTSHANNAFARYMTIAAWMLALVLLTWLFDGFLGKQRNPNQQVVSGISTDGLREVILTRNRQGHYWATGAINGQVVEFLVDTGATDVVVPATLAGKLKLTRGTPMTYQTANGIITAYRTKLDHLELGDISLQNVVASINPASQQKEVLLGMSVLRQLDFAQQGNNLIIQQAIP